MNTTKPNTTTAELRGYSLREAAQRLSLSLAGLRNLIKRGSIHTVTLGKRRIVSVLELERVLREGVE